MDEREIADSANAPGTRGTIGGYNGPPNAPEVRAPLRVFRHCQLRSSNQIVQTDTHEGIRFTKNCGTVKVAFIAIHTQQPIGTKIVNWSCTRASVSCAEKGSGG